jgi:hypothetical protein
MTCLPAYIIFCHILGLHVTFRQDLGIVAAVHLIVTSLAHITLSHSILIPHSLLLRHDLACSNVFNHCLIWLGKSANAWWSMLLLSVESVLGWLGNTLIWSLIPLESDSRAIPWNRQHRNWLLTTIVDGVE